MSAVSSDVLFFDAKLIQERDYWKVKLSQEMQPSNLMLDFERPPIYSSRPESVVLNLPGDLNRKLAELTGDSSFLLYTTLMAGLKICLHRYNRSDRIVVGSPPLKELGRANALAIVDEIDSSLTFREFLLQVRGTLLEAYARQAYPFDYLLRDLDVNSLDKKCPLFDVALSLEDIHGPLSDVNHDITFSFQKGPHGLSGRVEYNGRLFARETIEQTAVRLLRVLESALEDKNKRIREFNLLTAEERQTLLGCWNDTKTDYPDDLCVNHLFEAQVERTPEATAVVYEGQSLSFAELNARANRLAHFLRARGVGPESIVGLCLERSPELVVSILATLKAGGAYLPLEPTYPSQRLIHMMEDSGCRLVLTTQALAGRLDAGQAGGPALVSLDTCVDEIAAQSAENPLSDVGAENLAYVIYTSGSTGQPKGVMVTHRGLANYLQWSIDHYAVAQGEGAPIHSPLSFDLTVTSLFPPLLAGRRVELLKEEQGIEALVQALRRKGDYSLVKLTPTH
ncbi:MAG: AMP-binding protein, partial [Pyrinomonadaceae bacterium]